MITTRELVAETVAPAARINTRFVLRAAPSAPAGNAATVTVVGSAIGCGLAKVAVTSAVCPSMIVSGVTTSVIGDADCAEAGCALAGGETAELPGLYPPSGYDLAGFAVGAVERGMLITGDHARPGDVVLGLASNGLHSNGFSLVRSVVSRLSLSYADPAPFEPGRPLGRALLEPTRLYVSSCLAAARSRLVHALAHVTGGGLAGNLARVLPDGVRAEIDAASWPVPPVFRWLVNEGGVPPDDALRTFNMGIGMAVVAAAGREEETIRLLADQGETVFRIGAITDRKEEGPSVAIGGDLAL